MTIDNSKLRLSPSKADAYQRCPRQYWYRYEPDAPKIEVPPSPHLSYGNSLHEALKRIYHLGGPPQLSLSMLPQVLESAWKTEGYRTADEERARKKNALEVLEKFLERTRARPIRTLYVEKFLECTIEGVNFAVRIDRLDLLQPGLLIVDYKTGSALISENQLFITYLVVRSVHHSSADRPIRFSIHHLDRDEEQAIEVREEEALGKLNDYASVQEQILQREFSPTPSLYACRFCEAKKECIFSRA